MGIVVFDLDGVLFDTNEIVRAGYLLGGAQPPDDVLGSFGQTFPGRDRARPVKNAYYLEHVGEAPMLPAFDVASRLYFAHGHSVRILTSAPHGTIEAVRRTIQRPWPFTLCVEGMTWPGKRERLASWARAQGGVYVDDQQWSRPIPNWLTIWYCGQDNLYSQIIEGLEVHHGTAGSRRR